MEFLKPEELLNFFNVLYMKIFQIVNISVERGVDLPK